MGDIFEIIGALLTADIALLVAYVTKIGNMFNEDSNSRRKLLVDEFQSRINNPKSEKMTIDAFLPSFHEFETIEDWRSIGKQICSNFRFSIGLLIASLIFSLFTSITLIGIPIDVLFVVGGGLWLFMGLSELINHYFTIQKWKTTKSS